MNKIIKYAAIGVCNIILGLGNIQTIAAPIFAQCEDCVNIRKSPNTQSTIVGYIQNNAAVEILEKNEDGWIKIKSGNVTGWSNKDFFVQEKPKNQGYTVAIVHPQNLSVYIQPNKEATIYTTLYQGQEIQCVNYENDWLTLAFEDGSYGFIDAYQAELKTYYNTAQPLNQKQEEENTQQTMSNLEIETEIEYYQELEQYILEDSTEIISNEEINNFYTTELQWNDDNSEIVYNNINTENDQLSYYIYNVDNEQTIESQQIQTEFYSDIGDIYEPVIEQEEEYDEEESDEIFSIPEEEKKEINQNNNDIVNYADQYVGNPYVYGGNSLTDGIDCSHFVWQVLSNTGHYDGGYAVSDGWMNLGDHVDSLDDAVAGDVIVYPGHVAIYDGEGGIVEAKGSEWGITHDRSADSGQILAIRHFD